MPLPTWLSPLLACPRCGTGLEDLRCSRCGARYPFRGPFPDLRMGAERPLLALVNRFPLTAWSYEAWRVRSTALLSGGTLSFAEELAHLKAWLLPMGGPFLDVGTGTGVYREVLGVKAVGIDPSPAFLRVAARRRPGPYLLAHGEALPFRDGAFAGVAIGPTWNEFQNPRRAALEARRILRKGGRLFGMLLLGPGASLGLFRPSGEELLCLLREAGFRAELLRFGRLGLVLAEA
ncbi:MULTISPECIES: class I SAM-dependent methyltransferase [Thermus]|uniref:class I SAM-dependent methyltransferase n=1 Tax=Thermus TaxID=270 RepID=UPI001F398B7C|nr:MULTISPECIES: class I SAM-dependent methyltransferase [Thermus]